MTLSSGQKTRQNHPAKNEIAGAHWHELRESLSAASTDQLAIWLNSELAIMEEELDRFVTRRSQKNSLSR